MAARGGATLPEVRGSAQRSYHLPRGGASRSYHLPKVRGGDWRSYPTTQVRGPRPRGVTSPRGQGWRPGGLPHAAGQGWYRRSQLPAQGLEAARRSYPRCSSGQPGGAFSRGSGQWPESYPRPRLGAEAESYPMSEARACTRRSYTPTGNHSFQPGGATPGPRSSGWAGTGGPRGELLHVQGQEQHLRFLEQP